MLPTYAVPVPDTRPSPSRNSTPIVYAPGRAARLVTVSPATGRPLTGSAAQEATVTSSDGNLRFRWFSPTAWM
ncbi:hypothetical protein AB0J57_10935 [Streptomyces sp. NPDC049837]|uniref:hypothetical protein n=1 Tax=Streptomyces sp. NPDC049837 TaxID=3155277 RepID=UPI00343D5515